jgi:16S rRNA G966 N2-methylase RsmD
VKFIETTSQNLEMPIKAVMSDVLSFLQKTDLNANIIFADPPYDMGKDELEKIIAFVFEREILLPEGELIIEHAKKMDLSNSPQFLSKRKYGSSAFSFFINS